jgi:hypothetical protein
MIKGKLVSVKETPLLDKINTLTFLKDIETICNKVDFISLSAILQKYPFQNINTSEYDEFIEQAKREHDYWHNNPSEVKIKAVTKFDSKCIACSYGKTVKAYRVEYVKLNDDRLPGRIVYNKNFALNFEIKDNKLIDFGWCNKFLDREEMKMLIE